MASPDRSGFRVRPFAPADFPSLCEIDQLCFPAGIAYAPEEIAVALSQPGAFALVAEAESEVIGFVLAYQKKRWVGHIVTIDIRPQFRSQGVGRQLMQLAELRLAEAGAVRFVLEVAVENERATRFYTQLGYAIRRLLPRYYRDGSDAWLMEKAIAQPRP